MPQRHRQELSESVSADPLGTYRRTPRTFRPGRQCAVPGCETVLSIYNGAKHCAAHGPAQLKKSRARAMPEESAALAEELRDRPTMHLATRVLVPAGAGVSRRAS
jgi:hypothetical protein